jgi:hypothetical protein
MFKPNRITAALAALFASMVCRAPAEPCNFAKFQTVTASGKTSTYVADLAVDGVVSNFHSFRTNNTNNPHWLEVKFPRVVAIGSAHLYLGLDNDPAQGGLTAFKLQYHDGTSWADIPGASVTGNTSAERAVLFTSPVSSDRFRLHSDENGSRTIRELALFPPHPVGGVEQGYPIGTDVRLSLCHRRSVTASATHLANYPKLAVDGYVNDSSRWLSPATTAGDTLEVDLIVPHAVGSVHLHSGFGTSPVTNLASNFALDYWDGSAWAPIPGATFTTNTSPALVISVSPPLTTTRFRYRTTTANFARIRELLVFPPRSGGYPPGQDVETSAPPVMDWELYSDSSYQVRCGISDGRFLGYHNDSVRFANSAQDRNALGSQLLLNHRDGSHRIRHLATGKCLAPSQIGAVDNDPVILEDYSGMPHQDWKIQPIDATYFRIVNVLSGLALQTRFGDWTPGNPMSVRPVSGSDLQRWYMQNPLVHPKKGIAASHESQAPNTSQTWMENSWNLLNGPSHSWSYTWGRQSADAFPFHPPGHTHHPMQWSANMNHGATNSGGAFIPPLDSLRHDLSGGAKPVHLLGFNEPDRTDQANMTVSTAISLWNRLESMDAPLVSPAPGSASGTWFQDFNTQADALGLRRDFTAVHWYAAPDASSLIGFLQGIHTTYGKPVWLTEFSAVSWDGLGNWSKGSNFNFLAEFLWRAESLPWLKRYSLFQYAEGGGSGTDNPNAPRSNTRNADGSLTAFGELYAGWDAVTNVVNDKTYHIHNKGQYRRLRNPGATTPADLVATIDPDTPGAGTRWFLIPGTTPDTVRIVSRDDGRRLRYFSGTYVGMVAAANFTGQSEWRLVPAEALSQNQDGWYFIEHPQSGTRLQTNGSGTPVHGSATGNTDAFRWRFVVPLVSDNTAPVLAAIPPRTVSEGMPLTFTASATDADLPANTLSYTIVGAPAGASINPSTGVFTWTPDQTQGPAVHLFAIRVSDGALTHDQPMSVTVLENGGSDVLDTWIISGQSNAEGYGITQDPVPGLEGSATLATVGRGDLNVTHSQVNLFQGATDLSGSIIASAGLSLPPRDAWHAMTPYEGLAYDWGAGRGNESGRRFGPELAFGFDVRAMRGSPVALIKYARGNSSIAPSSVQSGGVWRDFDPDDGGRLNQYDKLVSTIQGALENLPAGQVLNIRGVLWMQGDGDAVSSALASAYQSNLAGLIASLRTDIGSIAASSGGRMTRSATSWNHLDFFVGTILNNSANATRQTVIDAQHAVAAADANVFAVNGTTGLSSLTVDDWGGTGIHYDTAGQVLLGERFADAAISRIDSGVLVSESGGTTTVTEGGASDTYTVTLTRAPSANVTISINTDSQVGVSPSSLIFTPGNWDTPQTVTVSAINDAANESNHSGSISHVLTSPDPSFGGLPISGVNVSITDNDNNTLPSAVLDADNDGLSDLLEHAFVTDPGTPNGNPFKVAGSAAGSITLEFPWNWQANGINWRIRHGADLTNIGAWPVVSPGTTTAVRQGNIDRITITPARNHPGRGFYVLEVFGN